MAWPVFFILATIAAVHCKLEPLSCDDRRRFVDGHNYRRFLLLQGQVPRQPAASEMKMMVWDEELATKASKWALEESNTHNPDKTVASGRFEVGENLYWFLTTNEKSFNIDHALDSWFSEHANFTYRPLQESDFDVPKDRQIGHYTQMAWSDTVYLGCAISKATITGRYKYHFLVVCNYGPTGNYLNETPYKTGNESRNKLLCDIKECSDPYGIDC